MNRQNQYVDINKWRATCREQKRRYYGRTANAKNSKNRYTPEETEMILSHEVTDHELAKLLGRSVAAIQIHRHKCRQKLGIEQVS